MLTQQENERARKALMINWFIWVVFFFSLAIYLGAGHLIGGQSQSVDMSVSAFRLMQRILMALGAIQLAVSFPLKKMIIQTSRGPKPLSRSSEPPRPKIEAVVGRYTIALVIALALCESVGIYGLVIFLMGGDANTFYLFVAAAATVMILHRPRMSEIESVFGY